uniref:Uncharacterized protein n=1 Tax=Amphimedon queenslandica TaxID=400682 RepID=A0A1X7TQ55_AMPQE
TMKVRKEETNCGKLVVYENNFKININ